MVMCLATEDSLSAQIRPMLHYQHPSSVLHNQIFNTAADNEHLLHCSRLPMLCCKKWERSTRGAPLLIDLQVAITNPTDTTSKGSGQLLSELWTHKSSLLGHGLMWVFGHSFDGRIRIMCRFSRNTFFEIGREAVVTFRAQLLFAAWISFTL